MPIANLRNLATQRISAVLPDEIEGMSCVLLVPMNEGSGNPKDYSGYQNHGTLHGPTWVDGRYGKALSFDGVDDYVNCGSDKSLASYGKDKITWEFWIYPKSDGEGDSGRIADRSLGYNFRVESEVSSAVRLEGFVSHVTTGADAITSDRIAVNAWHHVVFVYNEDGAKKIKIYADGALMALWINTAGVGALSNDTGSSLYIGNTCAGNRTFDGYIGLAGIHNRALSAEEIQACYLGGRLPILRSLGLLR